MNKHTPAPWRYVPHENGVEFDIVTGAEEPWPWYLATTHDMEGASEANARLIAAAPEMLEALKAIREWILFSNKVSDPETWPPAFRKANDLTNEVIAKAEGRNV